MPEVNGDPLAPVNVLYESAQTLAPGARARTEWRRFPDLMEVLMTSVDRGVSGERFKAIAGSLPTGVTVVTTLDAAGEPMGMTSGAVCGLSCDPPLLLVCIGRDSRTLKAILGRGAFCVNVLDADAAWVSDRFAAPAPDRFAGITWAPGPHGIPVLTDTSVAYATCECHDVVDGGDHVILIGLIVAGDHQPQADPLLYHRRRYAGFPSERHAR